MKDSRKKILTEIVEESYNEVDLTYRKDKGFVKNSMNLSPLPSINFFFEKDKAMEPLAYLDNLEFESTRATKKHNKVKA